MELLRWCVTQRILFFDKNIQHLTSAVDLCCSSRVNRLLRRQLRFGRLRYCFQTQLCLTFLHRSLLLDRDMWEFAVCVFCQLSNMCLWFYCGVYMTFIVCSVNYVAYNVQDKFSIGDNKLHIYIYLSTYLIYHIYLSIDYVCLCTSLKWSGSLGHQLKSKLYFSYFQLLKCMFVLFFVHSYNIQRKTCNMTECEKNKKKTHQGLKIWQVICNCGCFQELPLAVLKRPHCFCTWTSSLFNINQQADKQRCADSSVPNRTATSGSTAPPESGHYQVYHTPVLGENLSSTHVGQL